MLCCTHSTLKLSFFELVRLPSVASQLSSESSPSRQPLSTLTNPRGHASQCSHRLKQPLAQTRSQRERGSNPTRSDQMQQIFASIGSGRRVEVEGVEAIAMEDEIAEAIC
ncbi:hypothetical protein FH972_006204 [Carpinus fangiana]|uniref:Uncharacterized protein n=1 Tax=Carpinus fangiana TaxID=176857 RepID=A0A5N6QTY8_9ROSI|nr:hypothetical protein FH972_006204 [Carpinus fangiana]